MNITTLAVGAARARLAFGIAALAAPAVMVSSMTGRSPEGAEREFTRMWGGRDAALGLGLIAAVNAGGPVAGWLRAAAVADACDAVGAVLGRDRLSENGFKATLAIAGVSAAAHGLLAPWVDRRTRG
jgi:hypothetical protein